MQIGHIDIHTRSDGKFKNFKVWWPMNEHVKLQRILTKQLKGW